MMHCKRLCYSDRWQGNAQEATSKLKLFHDSNLLIRVHNKKMSILINVEFLYSPSIKYH